QDLGACAQAYFTQRCHGRMAQRGITTYRFPEAERMALMGLHRQRHVIESSEVLQHAGELERACQPQSRPRWGGEMSNITTGELHGASIRSELASQLGNQGGFPGTIGANQRVQLTTPDL